jgi:hypothetical protein
MFWGRKTNLAVIFDDLGRIFLIPEPYLDQDETQRYKFLTAMMAYTHENPQSLSAAMVQSRDVHREWELLSPNDIITRYTLASARVLQDTLIHNFGKFDTEEEGEILFRTHEKEIHAITKPVIMAIQVLDYLAEAFNKEKSMADAFRKAYDRGYHQMDGRPAK